MRKGTKSFVGIVSLGLVAAGYQAGLAAEISNGFSATPVTSTASGATGSSAGGTSAGGSSAGSETLNTPAPTATQAAPTASSVPETSTAPAATPKATTAAPAASSTPKATVAAPAPVSTPKATTAAPAATPAATGTTKTGSAINYRYGTVQVSVTKANGKITAVNLLQAGATGGRQAAFSYLVDYAIQANGSSFGNLGGATFTVDAFKQSLESALAKF